MSFISRVLTVSMSSQSKDLMESDGFNVNTPLIASQTSNAEWIHILHNLLLPLSFEVISKM